MRTLFIIFIIIYTATLTSHAQNIYFKTGINSTKYNFKDQKGEKVSGFIPSVGSSFELGISQKFANDWLKYEFGITLDSYNATGGDHNNNYSWDTNYGGIRNTVSFIPTTGDFSLGFLGILGGSTIFNGTQMLNNARYDLKNHPEFDGLFFQAGLGLSISYNVFNKGFLSLQYDYSKSFRTGQRSEEKLSYLNNRILFGIHFQLD